MRPLDQHRHSGPFSLEPLTDGLVLQEPGVDALKDHGQLEAAKRHVVADAGQVPAGQFRVPGGQLGPGEESRHGRDRRPDADVQPLRIGRIGPVDEGQAQVGQRVAERGHLPVHDRRHPWLRGLRILRIRRAPLIPLIQRDEHVVQPEVPVDQRVITVIGQAGGEPFHQPVVTRHLPRRRQLPLPLPAGQLPGQVPLRAAEPGQSGLGNIYLVDRRQHLGEPF
jgi:hypothetical protein